MKKDLRAIIFSGLFYFPDIPDEYKAPKDFDRMIFDTWYNIQDIIILIIPLQDQGLL